MSSSHGLRPWKAEEEGVVVVVPRLAEGDPGEPPDVARLVLDAEAARAEEVADGVDRPGDVVEQEDPDQAAPEHRLQAGAEVPPQTHPARKGRAATARPRPEPARDEDHAAVGEQVLRGFVHSARPTLRKSQPTCACQRPASLPRTPGRSRRGECGSPSRSAKLWCLRWSETQRITGPAPPSSRARRARSGCSGTSRRSDG